MGSADGQFARYPPADILAINRAASVACSGPSVNAPRTFGEALERAPLTNEQLAYLRDYGDWPSYDPPVSPDELRALVLELIAFRTLPRHAPSCGNQNVVDPVGAYRGVTKCGCNR